MHGLRMSLSRPFLFLCLLAQASASAWAARPMTTDDARVVDHKACQVESWFRKNHEGPSTFWAVPGCSPVENLEISVGGALERHDGQRRQSDSLAQAKFLVRTLQPNDWGAAITLGRSVERGLTAHARDLPSHFVNIPLSYSWRNDAAVLHLNLGRRDDRELRKQFNTWGLGSEVVLRPNLQLIVETYGESGSRAFLHGGLRYWVIPNRVQIDTTYGTERRSHTQQHWFSIGLRLLSPPFLP